MLLSFLLLAQASVLDNWRAEIEQLDHSKILIMRVAENTPPPADPEARSIITEVFRSPGFASQFSRAEAMSVTNGKYHFVLINPALTPDSGYEAVLGHEFGHLWLKAMGYPSLVYQGGDAGCLAINAGDMIQHVLIREQLDRRKISWRGRWHQNLEKTADALEQSSAGQPVAPICQRLAQIAMWVDVRLGIDAGQWKDSDRFEKAMSAAFPELRKGVGEIAETLSKLNLSDKTIHRQALQFAFNKLKSLGLEIDRKHNETKSP
jgi:hypothetical protein